MSISHQNRFNPDCDGNRHAVCLGRLSDLLLGQRTSEGIWEGQLSTSALSTATASMALTLAARATQDEEESQRFKSLLQRGLQWLEHHQNSDGGWGDTTLSISNISTSMLAYAVLNLNHPAGSPCIQRAKEYVDREGGVPAVIRRYGSDHTFSVPILTHCALAGIVPWKDVIPLPFELACVPAKWYAAVRMRSSVTRSRINRHRTSHLPESGTLESSASLPAANSHRTITQSARVHSARQWGFLEATPLTSFVCMSLLGCNRLNHPVTRKCLSFIEQSVRPDGSWPIDTNLTTWVTTLSVNALSGNHPVGSQPDGDRPPALLNAEQRTTIREWLLKQQYREIHPYTNAAPGGCRGPSAWWSPDAERHPWRDPCPAEPQSTGGVVDRSRNLSSAAGHDWLLNLQNRDGGWPTFCRGWGKLPFDRSSNDLTAHAIRALDAVVNRVQRLPLVTRDRISAATIRGLTFLKKTQRSDGTCCLCGSEISSTSMTKILFMERPGC